MPAHRRGPASAPWGAGPQLACAGAERGRARSPVPSAAGASSWPGASADGCPSGRLGVHKASSVILVAFHFGMTVINVSSSSSSSPRSCFRFKNVNSWKLCMGCLKRGEKEQVLTIFEHFYNMSQRSGRLPTTQRMFSGQKWIQRHSDTEPRGAVPAPCPARARRHQDGPRRPLPSCPGQLRSDRDECLSPWLSHTLSGSKMLHL